MGSDVVEAGCKTIMGHRLKQSGMHLTVRGANAIVVPTLLPTERPLGGILGGSLSWIALRTHKFVAHPKILAVLAYVEYPMFWA